MTSENTTVPAPSRLTPNPYSPYADADPQYRHIFASPIFFPDPMPGVLAIAACEGMAVVPEKTTETAPGRDLPDGLCPACVTVMQGGEPPERPVTDCRECDSRTDHDGLCALCRQEKHEQWWPTREGTDYVKPGDRPAEWARMAGELAADGIDRAEIAARLCVDVPTVDQLLDGTDR